MWILPLKDFRAGDVIVKICGVSLEGNVEDEVFGAHFADKAVLLVRRFPK